MATVFSKIISREIPAYIVYEDEICIAFLDVFPLKRGHLLLVPKQEIDYLFDLPSDVYKHLMAKCYDLAKALKSAFACKKIGIAVVGFEVPHAHIHLVPMDNMHDLNFSNQKLNFSNEEFEIIKVEIKAKLT
jgi:histidine triad (HIT) family protein